MRRSTRNQVRAALLALTVVAVTGIGAARAGTTEAAPAADTESLATSSWRRLNAGQRRQAFSKLKPEQAEAMQEFMETLSSGGKVPVSAQGKIAGYVDASTLRGNRMPRSRGELASVKDSIGRIVAYWGGPLGVVDRSTADRPQGFDLSGLAARRGLTREGRVRDEILSRLRLFGPPSPKRPSGN